jgi:hypothetical protein
MYYVNSPYPKIILALSKTIGIKLYIYSYYLISGISGIYSYLISACFQLVSGSAHNLSAMAEALKLECLVRVSFLLVPTKKTKIPLLLG